MIEFIEKIYLIGTVTHIGSVFNSNKERKYVEIKLNTAIVSKDKYIPEEVPIIPL